MVYSVTKICKISFNLFDGIVQNLNDNTLVLLASITEKQLYESIEKYANISQDKFKLTLFFSGKVIQLNLNRNSSMGQLLGPKFSYSEDTNHVLAVTNPDFSLTPPCSVVLITSGSPKEYFIFWDDECTMVYTEDGSQKPTRYKKRKEELDAFYSNLISNCETNMDDSTSRQEEENFSLEPLTLKSEPCYVGLVNQAMTCYLNSLLQALYMTPEFRNALYNWEYVDGSEKDEANSIPYQLQILFLKLQTSSKSAVETTSLTKSFGWDSTEVWQQHDIQELCRVMFDALEQKFANTEQADLIKRLYEGKMIDYVKCLECGTEKTREDTFLDIPLPVRPFGSNVAYNSVEEALQAFVQYETLEGTNQYHCEKCNKKCDAHKGLKFTKFPYLLTLHLKRFDFDYKTFHRIKLNDKVTFPDVLNLNSLIDISTNQEPSDNKKTTNSTDTCDINSATDTGTTNENGVACENSLCNSSQDEKDGEDTTDMCNGPSTSNCSTQTQESENNSVKYQPEDGPYQYELFSIMIHSGSANGGHYYAYIKDFRTQEWMCFNDQIVSHITHDDIKKTYGGGISGAYYSGVYSSSTNAYMLMYRQIDPARNALPMHAQDFPKHMQELLEKVAMNDVKCHEKITVLKIRVYYRQLRGGELRYIKIYEIADATLAQLTEMVYTRLFLHKIADLNQCRLVSYDPISGLTKESFEGREEETIGSIWSTQERITVLLDIRQMDENFEAYSPNEILSKVYVIDAVKTEIIDGPINVDIPPHIQTVKEYKQMLGPILDMDPEQMEIGLWRYLDTKWLENDYELHRSESSAQNTFFVSCVPETDRKTFRECTSHAISARFENVFSVIIELPDTSPEALKALNIAPLEEKPKKIEKSTLPKETEKTVVANEQSKPSVNYSCRENSERCWLWSPREDEEEWYTPEQSNSEDSSLSDSDKTLVGVAPDEGDNLEFVGKGVVESSDSDNDCEYYFKATPNTGTFVDSLNVYVDARIKVGTLKKHLEPYVGVSADSFNLYDLEGASEVKYSATDILTYVFRSKLVIKLDDGKFPVKIHQLVLNSDEPYKFLFHYYLSTNMTVREAKQEILSELKNKFNIEIPYERFRLRLKKFKMPSRVLFDDQKIEEGQRHFEAELIIQELTEDETVTDPKQTIVYARRWHNEDQLKSQVGPLQEIVLDERSAEEIRRKISAISDIPEEYIETTRGIRLFPCNDIAFFQLSHGCDNIQNGVVFLYRDSRENFKTPRPRKVAEYVPSKQKSRRGVQLPETPCHNPRRERGLKIHVDSK